MKQSLIFFLLSILFIFNAKSQSWNWTQQVGGDGADYISDMAVDQSGNVYTCGSFENTITIGTTSLTSAGEYDIFIAKHSASGSFIWASQAGGDASDAAKGILVDTAGNIYISGYFEGNATFNSNTIASEGARDLFICKYDTSGNLTWVEHAGGSGIDEANVITSDASGNIYVAGIFNGTASFDTTSIISLGQDDIFTASYNTDGSLQWVSSLGGPANDNVSGISCDYNNVFISAYFNDTLFVNQDTMLSIGSTDALIAKYDASGNLGWVKNYGSGNYDYASGIASTNNGYFYITGYYNYLFAFGSDTLWGNGATDFFIAMFDTAGNYQWSRKAGGADFDYTFDITTDVQGNAYIAGAIKDSLVTFYGGTQLQSAGGYDAFAAKYSQQGTLVWAQQLGGENYDYAYTIAVDTSGTIYLGGTFENSIPIGNDTLVCEGLTDIFIGSYTNFASNITNIPIQNINLLAYPNPNSGEFTLSIKGNINEVGNIIITNTLGQIVYSTQTEFVNNLRIPLNIGNQPKGLYQLSVSSKKAQVIFRMVIQ